MSQNENRITDRLEVLAADVQRQYERAVDAARDRDANQAGHGGEATWEAILNDWGPGLRVGRNKYIIGPNGRSNEIDLVLFKRDYPAQLATEAYVLSSGVAAAFSVKTTLRKHHLAEALEQKQRVLEAVGDPVGTVKDIVCGPFPFGMLAHSSDFLSNDGSAGDVMKEGYIGAAYSALRKVQHPRDELDAILVADRGFWWMHRSTYTPNVVNGQLVPGGPSSALMTRSKPSANPGAPLAQFIAWLSKQGEIDEGRSSMTSLDAMFGPPDSSGRMTRWPLNLYPDHIQENMGVLFNEYGSPIVYR